MGATITTGKIDAIISLLSRRGYRLSAGSRAREGAADILSLLPPPRRSYGRAPRADIAYYNTVEPAPASPAGKVRRQTALAHSILFI